MENLAKIGDKDFKETAWSFATKGSTLILFVFLNLILARKLGVESFGLWSLFLSVITLIFTLSYFGVNSSARKFIAQYGGTNDLKNIFLSSVKLRFIFSLIFSILLLLSDKYIAKLLDNPDLEILFLYGVPLLFLSGFVQYFKDAFEGLHRIKYNFIVNTCEFGLKLVLVFLFLSFSSSVISVVNSFTVALLVTTIVGFCILYLNFYKNLKNSNKDFTKEILNYSYPLLFISLGFIALTEIDTIMIGYFSTSSEVGIYSVAKQISIKLPHIALAIVMGTMPVFAKLNKKNNELLKDKLFKILKINTGIYIPLVLSLLIFSPILIPLLFGNEYVDAVLPLQILSIYIFFVAISMVLGFFLDYVGRAKARAYNIIATIVLNIILNMILIPQYGAAGAALATLISYLPYVLLNWLEVRRVLTINSDYQ